MLTTEFKVLVNLLIAVNIHYIESCPLDDIVQRELKGAYKSGEVADGQELPITLDKIKTRLKESNIFDWQDPTLTDMEKKEMSKLFDAVEIMVTSRNRQPSNVQNMFSSLRLLERVVKKQLKESQISESLADRFHWERLSHRQRREKSNFKLDSVTNMRIFNTN